MDSNKTFETRNARLKSNKFLHFCIFFSRLIPKIFFGFQMQQVSLMQIISCLLLRNRNVSHFNPLTPNNDQQLIPPYR